jgi:hypothetical protein
LPEEVAVRRVEEGTPIAEVCRKAEIGEATYYNGARNIAAW